MVDNIKIRLAHTGKQEVYRKCKFYKADNIYSKRYYIPSPSINGKPLTMEVDYYPNNNRTVIDIIGSWRKWYHGKGASKDLSYLETLKCIKEIAKSTGLPETKILNAKIENIELGFVLKFSEKMGGIINAFVFYKGFDTIYEYSRESVKFGADAYNIAFYDKYSELMSKAEKRQKKQAKEFYNRTGKRLEKKKSKKLLAKKLNKNNFALRFEVKITKPSGCPPEFVLREKGRAKLLIASPLVVLNNWNKILNGLDTMFCRATFSEYNLNVGLDFLRNKGLKELSMYETHITAIVVGGVNNYIQLLMRNLKSNHRDTNIKKKINVLNLPPPELRVALKSCRNKKDLVFVTKNRRIKELTKK